MKNGETTLDYWLHQFNVGSIDELSDEACCFVYNELYPDSGALSALLYYDEIDAKERKDFAKDVRKCLTSELRITIYHLMYEGVADDENRGLNNRPYIYEVK